MFQGGGGPQENLNALQRAIDSMEEKGLQEDPRYSQLLALRARQANMEQGPGGGPVGPGPVAGPGQGRPPPGNQGPPPPQQQQQQQQQQQGFDGSGKHSFTSPQLQQLRVQIMAYRLLARNQPLSQQLALAVQGNYSYRKLFFYLSDIFNGFNL